MRLSANDIRDIARTNTTPISIARSVRQINQICATSMPAGKMVPVTAFPLLREDQLRNSMIHCKVDLMETAEIIKNGIKCRFMAYFVPFLAFERFNGGMDEFNRSYMKQNIADGATDGLGEVHRVLRQLELGGRNHVKLLIVGEFFVVLPLATTAAAPASARTFVVIAVPGLTRTVFDASAR